MWVARQDRAPLSDLEGERLETWLAADPRHLGAFTRAKAVWIASERANALGLGFSGVGLPPSRVRKPAMVSRRMLAAGFAAAVVGGPAAVALWPKRARAYRTHKGEVTLLSLDDGSSMALSTGTAVKVLFGRREREVVVETGEVLIDAIFERGRPFVVRARDATLTGLQAQFAVRATADRPVELLVRSGRLEAQRAGWSAPVAAGALQTLVLSDTPRLTKVDEAEVERRLAWRDGEIVFEGEDLAQAAARFADFSPVRLVIDDPAVAAERVTGRFSASDPIGFARAVASIFDLQVHETSGAVHLSRRKT